MLSPLKQMLLSHQRERIRLEYSQKTQLEALKGKQYVYLNQKEAANKVIVDERKFLRFMV